MSGGGGGMFTTGVWILFLALAVLTPSVVYANAGLPMIVVVWPGMWILLAIVILVEAKFLAPRIGVDFKAALGLSAKANFASTLVGYPLAWGVLLAVEIATTQGQAWGLGNFLKGFTASVLQAAWLIPYENDLDWIIPIATAINLLAAFFVSWILEAWVISWYVKRPFQEIRLIVRNANLITYGILLILVLIASGVAWLK
jgi:hypothetical protein